MYRQDQYMVDREQNTPTHFLVPLMIQCCPSAVLTAVVRIPATSLPANASEIARQMSFLPPKTSGITFALISGEPKCRTGGRPITEPIMRPLRNRSGTVFIFFRMKDDTISITALTGSGKFLCYD